MKLSRRCFFPRLAAAGALPGLTFAQPGETADESPTLVCVFLRGGADTLNLWVPYADDRYYRQRPTLAIRQPGEGTGRAIRLTEHYALHPALQPLEGAFKEGRLGAVQSVAVDNTSGSHFECQDQMEHGQARQDETVGGGWLGRFLRTRPGNAAGRPSPLAAVALGTAIPESLRGAPAASVMQRLEDLSLKTRGAEAKPLMSAIESLYSQDQGALGQQGQETIELFRRVAELRAEAAPPGHGAVYPGDDFGSQLNEVARLIKARVGLRVACLDLGGWDTHFVQGSTSGLQAERARILAEGLHAFDTDLTSHRALYTVMVTTEFGRRTYENASLGTDHGRGFTFMALGDRVKGGQVIGRWPIPFIDEFNPLGPGGIEMETDFRRVFAEVLRGAFRLTEAELAQIFPRSTLDPVGLFASV